MKTDKQKKNGINNGHFGILGKDFGILGGRPCKVVLQYSKDGELIATYKSVTEAAKTLGLRDDGISRVANGFSKTCGGFIWKYEN